MKGISRIRDEKGMTYVFVGLGMLALFGASALAIDVGMIMTARSQAQVSADAGALAGATALAFDDFDDRSATGPAVTNATTTAKANLMMGTAPSVDYGLGDITFPAGPGGLQNRIQVRVMRAAARSDALPTFIAGIFNVNTVDVGATATAEVTPANAMTCVKPFTIPDKWIENQTPPWDTTDSFSRYNNKGVVLPDADVYEPAYTGCDSLRQSGCVPNPKYSGYNSEQNRGSKLVLRAAVGSNIMPSFFFSLAMTGDTGGSDYDWNIANCNHSIYTWGDPLVQEPGAMTGPTIDGIEGLIARDPGAVWDDGCNCVMNSAYGSSQSPRIFPIPLYDPDYYDFGKQTGRVASLKTANWIGFFVEYIGGSTEIHGRIIPIGGIYDKTLTGGLSAFPVAIRLVQ
jgi:hypothetical protein